MNALADLQRPAPQSGDNGNFEQVPIRLGTRSSGEDGRFDRILPSGDRSQPLCDPESEPGR
jgi:hypothetical protein